MKPEEINLGDWHRILMGEVPAHFYLEAVLRLLLLYLIMIVSLRLLGKRMASKMGRTEMVAMVSLAAAIGIPMLAPERGVLPGVITAAVVVLVGRSIARAAASYPRAEALLDDVFSILVKSGEMQPKAMLKSRITRERLMAQLRTKEIYHLGEVEWLFLEANGSFSMVQKASARSGLAVLPQWDHAFMAMLSKVPNASVCWNCGWHRETGKGTQCPNCSGKNWSPAVIRENTENIPL